MCQELCEQGFCKSVLLDIFLSSKGDLEIKKQLQHNMVSARIKVSTEGKARHLKQEMKGTVLYEILSTFSSGGNGKS
jgi:hypothetical protein